MHKTLRIGSRGAGVTAVQRELQSRLAPTLVIDGTYGKETEAAVRRFQKAVGFQARDVDGEVGPKTMLALFQTFDMKIHAHLVPDLKPPAILSPADPPVSSRSGSPVLPAKPAPAASTPEPPPKRFQSNLQFGPQGSLRDGAGLQLQLALTFRSRNYFPHSDKHKFYHGAHVELIPALSCGFPVAKGSIFTGQIAVTVQPLTDWLVVGDRWHLFTPVVGIFGQIPLDPRDAAEGTKDPATHSRLGGTVGGELFHFDILPDRLAIGVSGQESFYWDFKDRRLFWDPSVMGFIQGTLGSWSQYKPAK
jgi:Putative peptidoglycan binding domain